MRLYGRSFDNDDIISKKKDITGNKIEHDEYNTKGVLPRKWLKAVFSASHTGFSSTLSAETCIHRIQIHRCYFYRPINRILHLKSRPAASIVRINALTGNWIVIDEIFCQF